MLDIDFVDEPFPAYVFVPRMGDTMYDFQKERLYAGRLRNDQINRELLNLHIQEFHIESICLRFQSSPLIYPISCVNQSAQERRWGTVRDVHESYIQEWLTNSYLGNTRTNKRKHDLGWKLLGFWDRGKNGFLHSHGFLAFYRGPKNALSYERQTTMQRLRERNYHPSITDVHLSTWRGPNSNAVAYANKGSWRSDCGRDIIFVAVGSHVSTQ